jgi:ABC-2 type transport system permease protein
VTLFGDLRRVIVAWPAIFRVAMAGMVAYRAEMIIWVLSATLPLVMMALWNAAAAGGAIDGWGQTELTRYFAVNLVVRQLTGSWIVWELNWSIRKGELSPKLLRPMNPLVFNLAETLAALPFRGMVLAPLLGILVVWRPDVAFWPGLGPTLAFLVSTGLAWAVAWVVQAIFGLVAFWYQQSMGLWSGYFAIWSLCGGYFVPLALFPPGLAESVRFLPFYATLGAPIDVVLGVARVGPTLLLQAAWLVVLSTIAARMWNLGIRRYGAVGAGSAPHTKELAREARPRHRAGPRARGTHDHDSVQSQLSRGLRGGGALRRGGHPPPVPGVREGAADRRLDAQRGPAGHRLLLALQRLRGGTRGAEPRRRGGRRT